MGSPLPQLIPPQNIFQTVPRERVNERERELTREERGDEREGGGNEKARSELGSDSLVF